ncbi:hypothetical protein [Modestobacter sp. SYSU DS0290]
MFPRHSHTPNAAVLHVLVADLPGVQRVLTLLIGRNHTLTRCDAEEAGAGRWSVRLDVIADPDELDLLEARLHRIPSVLTVDVRSRGALAATA